MRIIHVIPALTKGGAEKVLVDLANEARRRGHEIAVVCGFPVDPRLIRDRLDPAIELRYVSEQAGDKSSAYRGLTGWLWRERRWLDSFDVVHCHLTYAAIFGSMLTLQQRLRRCKGPAVVETFHGVGMPIRPRQRWLAATLARSRDGLALMAEDAFWSDFRIRHPLMPSAVIPNGISINGNLPAAAAAKWRDEQGIPNDAMLIGTIGRLRAERNPLATLRAFAVAAQAMPRAHFIICGDGPMLDEVRSAGDAMGLGTRLHLPGLVLDPRVALANIALYVSMNVGPITGIAGLEAAAAGLPVIALQATANYAMGHGDWIWSDPDPDSVGQEILRLLAAPAELASICKRQQAYVATHHSVGTMQDAYERLYGRAIISALG